MLGILAIIVAVLAIPTLAILARGSKPFALAGLYARCRRAGFSFEEYRRFRKALLIAGVRDPLLVFDSAKEMDRVIAVLDRVGRGEDEAVAGSTKFFDKVYAIRKDLELGRKESRSGIRSSRQMAQGQRVRLLVAGIGVFNATVVDNNNRYLVLSYPQGPRLPAGFVWQGKKVSVYFWRRDDAGYVFDSYAIDDMRIRNVPVIHIGHSESLLRTQKRKSVRARASLPAYLYLLKRIEGAFEKSEREPGMRSMVQDLSEDGFSLAVGGKARPGLLVKAQFALGERQIVMTGTVRSVDYDATKNRSLLHVEAVPPSPRTRNAIRSYVYGQGAGSGAGGQGRGALFAENAESRGGPAGV